MVQQSLFGDTAPHVRSSDTSKAAARSIEPQLGRLQGKVLEVIQRRAALGATTDEVEFVLAMSHQTVSARVKELRDKGLIRDKGTRRPTRSGRAAVVYVAV